MSTEQKYPEHLVETVAKALFAGYGANGYHLDAHYRIEAVKVLDALGLTVTEEWAVRNERDWIIELDPCDEGTARRSLKPGDSGLARRTILHAETPWMEVASDGE